MPNAHVYSAEWVHKLILIASEMINFRTANIFRMSSFDKALEVLEATLHQIDFKLPLGNAVESIRKNIASEIELQSDYPENGIHLIDSHTWVVLCKKAVQNCNLFDKQANEIEAMMYVFIDSVMPIFRDYHVLYENSKTNDFTRANVFDGFFEERREEILNIWRELIGQMMAIGTHNSGEVILAYLDFVVKAYQNTAEYLLIHHIDNHDNNNLDLVQLATLSMMPLFDALEISRYANGDYRANHQIIASKELLVFFSHVMKILIASASNDPWSAIQYSHYCQPEALYQDKLTLLKNKKTQTDADHKEVKTGTRSAKSPKLIRKGGHHSTQSETTEQGLPKILTFLQQIMHQPSRTTAVATEDTPVRDDETHQAQVNHKRTSIPKQKK